MDKTCNKCACNKVCNHDLFGFENCGNFISAADVVEVIRCKDCEHYEQFTTGCDEMVCELDDLFRNPDDFCSYGERKDGDGK